MKKAIALIALMILSAVSVLGNWDMPNLPDMRDPILEPKLPCLPDKILVSGLTGTFEYTGTAMGGWYYDGGWSLEDFQHPTAIDSVIGHTHGVETYLVNYKPSGTEASGNAWEYAAESYFESEGFSELDNQLAAWTVNPVPPGGQYTHLFVEEFNFLGDSLARSLVVDGYAKGDLQSPTIIQSEFATYSPFIQERVVKIN